MCICLRFQGEELHGNNVSGLLCLATSMPGMARTIHGDQERFMDVYYRPYPGNLKSRKKENSRNIVKYYFYSDELTNIRVLQSLTLSVLLNRSRKSARVIRNLILAVVCA